MISTTLAASWPPLANVTSATLATIQLLHVFYFDNLLGEPPQCALYVTSDDKVYQYGTCPGGRTGELDELRGLKVTGFATGWYHALCWTDSGATYSWGDNKNGQLGVGGRVASSRPKLVKDLDKNKIIRLAAGAKFSLALTDSGKVFQWGQVDGSYEPEYNESYEKPKQLKLKDITQISGGATVAAALAKDGKLYTWGYGRTGMLCRGNKNNQPSFNITPVEGIVKLKQVAASELSLMLLTEQGRLLGCGKTNGISGGSSDVPVDSDIPQHIETPEPIESIYSSWAEQVFVARGAVTKNLYKWGETLNVSAPQKGTSENLLEGFKGHQFPSFSKSNFRIILKEK